MPGAASPSSPGIEALVIGASGLVGGHVAAILRSRKTVATTRTGVSGTRPLDVTDPDAVSDVIRGVRPRVIVLAAAVADVERCERDPSGTARVNVGATAAAAAAAEEVGARLVVFSSEYVFSGGGGRYREDDPVAPINEYGRQKVALERCASRVPGHLIARTSGVFGWEDACKNFVCRSVRTLRGGGTMPVPADQVITPTYAGDLAAAVVELVDRRVEGLVHVAGPRTVERLWFGRLVARTFELDEAKVEGRPSSEMGYLARRPLNCGLDDGLLRRSLGHPLRGPEEALLAMRASEPA